MTRAPIRLAIVGAGAWGINHVRVVSNDSRCQLVLVVDRDPAARERAHTLAPTAHLSADVERALGDPGIDAVILATPAKTHVDLARAAIAARKHILIEKPLALSERDARAIAAAAAPDRVFMVGHLMAFHPAVTRLRDMLRSGELGRLHYIHSTRANLGRIRQDETALWSFGPHELSMLDYLLERSPVSVSARGHCVVRPTVEDVVFVTLRYAEGEMAHMHLSWLHPRKERALTLVCSRRMVEFDDVSPEKLRIYDKGYNRPPDFTQFAEYLTLRDGDVYIPQLSMHEPLRLQLDHFLHCVDTGEVPRTGLQSALRITATLDAAQRSLGLDGIPVSVT